MYHVFNFTYRINNLNYQKVESIAINGIIQKTFETRLW